MVEIIIAVAAEVAKFLVAPIGRQFNYLCCGQNNFMKLKNEAKKLKNARDKVQLKVDDAKKNVKMIEPDVEEWQGRVNEIIAEADKLIEETEKPNNRCFRGLSLNLISSYKQSREASKKVKAVAELLLEEEKFGEVARTINHEDIWLITDKGYEAFESRMSILKDILDTLNDADVKIVGVYGMGGIGKTTLVKEVGRHAKKNKLFNEVIFVEISETPDIKEIQEVIANELDLKFDNEKERERKLYARLKNEKKMLIILDNIWTDDLDLEKIGIPVGDDPEGCKLLLTTREHSVLKSMDAKTFSIDVLNEEESWSMFKKMAGNYIENRELKPIANDVLKECRGLPIVIVTIAKALRNKSLPEWKDALRELRRPSPTNFKGVLEPTYSKIELSYKYLKSEELKKTLLLCSLMARDASMSDLLKYAMGLDLLEGDILDMEDARNRLDKLVHELKDSCLLLDIDISMHDVVRAVAIAIARRDESVIIVQNDDQIEWPNKNILGNCGKVSLLSSNVSELPEVLECPQLEFFHMYTRKSSFTIPDNFFLRMEKLKVLSLTSLPLLSLPLSLRLLTTLQTLCLDYSELEDIVIIGELKKLKILSLQNSEIKQLPKEIGQLTQLRLLDLSDCSKLEVIAPNVISNLSRLEELYMSNCSIKWEVEGLNIERSKASLDELKHLSRLSTLEIEIKDDRILPKGLFSKKLERYEISIGGGCFWRGWETSRRLELKLNSSICLKEMHGVIKNVEELCVDGLNGVRNVLYELDEDGFPQLKHLNIQNNPNFLYVVDSKDLVPCDVLPLLESLYLSNLINLEKISCRHLTIESFCKLKSIDIQNCDKLENIFSFSSIKGLPQLQDIYVSECKNLKQIFAIEGEDDVNNNEVIGNVEFLQLNSLRLSGLPQLTSFCSKVKTSSTFQEGSKELKIESQSNDVILKDECDTPTSLFNAKDVFPNLEVLNLTRINSERIWDSQMRILSPCCQNLTRLCLGNCQKLKSIFSASMVKSLEQLQYLDISSCKILKEIVAKEGGTEEAVKFVFPRLIFLSLKYLPELVTFYPGIHTFELPMLKKLYVFGCYKLFNSEFLRLHDCDGENQIEAISAPQSLFLINPNLEELSFSGNLLTMIQYGQFPENFFCKLKVLEVSYDESTNIPIEILEIFKNTEKLKLSNCPYKEIFSCRQDEKLAGTFTQIKSLDIHNLKDLTYLWKQDFILDSIFQNLEILSLSYCNELVNIVSSSASFRNLVVLSVTNCSGLTNLVTSSTAKSFLQLREMKISNCSMIVEIVENPEDERRDEIVLSKLKLLSLQNLGSLISFCSGNYTLKFPILEKLIVDGCPEMKTFSGGILSTPRLQKVIQNYWRHDEGCWEDDLNTTIQQIHMKSNGSNLEELSLYRRHIRMIRQGQFPKHFFCKLKVLEVNSDESINIPVEILQRFKNMEKLKLRTCPYKEIFSRRQDEKQVGTLTRIKCLDIYSLKNLKYLWKQDSILDSIFQNLEILSVKFCNRLVNMFPSLTSFGNLTILEVRSCCGLINLVTSSIAKRLVQLREMKIERCTMMVEIVGNEADEARDEIVFDKLKLLYLDNLKSLTSFYSGNCTLKFPSLEELIIKDCLEMKSFSREAISTPRLQKVNQDDWGQDEGCCDLNTTIQQLQKIVVNNNLEELTLSGEDIKMIWQGQFSEHYSALKVLEVIKDKSTHIPSRILQKFNDLEKLILKGSSYKEIFSFEDGEKHPGMLMQIKTLKLWGLCDLKYFWKQNSQLDSILQHLEILNVRRCHNLTNLMPSSASFENLTTLSVWYCDRLINLMTSQTIKSLVQLKEVRIAHCEIIMEIVANEEGATNEEIVFNKLKSLSLKYLESLTSFYFGFNTLKFPALEELFVERCPKMKTFSGGILSTPRLHKVKQDKYSKAWWEGDLNSTIQQLYKEVNVQSSENDADQSSMQPSE